MSHDLREGETALPFDPAETATGPRVTFIGRIRSPWQPGDAPRNVSRARETGCKYARIELEPAYIPGLTGLEAGRQIILLYWMDRGRRDLILQRPSHLDGPRGTFVLRSPVRPNPIAMATVRITGLDTNNGIVEIDAIDCYDNTPLLDIKPWIRAVDAPHLPD